MDDFMLATLFMHDLVGQKAPAATVEEFLQMFKNEELNRLAISLMNISKNPDYVELITKLSR